MSNQLVFRSLASRLLFALSSQFPKKQSPTFIAADTKAANSNLRISLPNFFLFAKYARNCYEKVIALFILTEC